MFKRILVSPLEVAKGEDIINLQVFLNNGLERFLQAFLARYGNGAVSGVLTGFAVTLDGLGTSFAVSAGTAVQTLSSPLAPSTYPYEIIDAEVPAFVPAQPPFSGAVGTRYDIVEMRAKAATITDANRPFLQPSGATQTQTTPKVATSLPELRLRSGITGATAFDVNWLPLAIIEVTGTPTSPSYTFIDVRPLWSPPVSGTPGVSELSSPAIHDDVSNPPDQCVAIPRSGVRFDGARYFTSGSSFAFKDILEGGAPLPYAGVTLFHLWIAKPTFPGFHPNVAQLILSTTGPADDGSPLNPLVMRAPIDGFQTVHALHLGAIPIEVTSVAGPPTVYTFRCSGYRKVGLTTVLPGLSVYYSPNAPSTNGHISISLPMVPKSAALVRVSYRTLYNSSSATTLGAQIKVSAGDGTKTLAPVGSDNYFATNGSPLNPLTAPTVVDLPVNHNASGAYATLEFQAESALVGYFLNYRIIGWTESPDGSYVTTG